MTGSRPLVRSLLLPLVATLLVGVAACSGGSNTQCGANGCTITFPRSGQAAVSVLGVEARLVGVDTGQATIQVAGQTVTVPVGATTQAEGFTVGVESVTDTEVVVRVQPSLGG